MSAIEASPITEGLLSPSTVMTFNIKGAENKGVPPDTRWGRRKGINVRLIQKVNPSLIGFQEAQYGNLEAYQDKMGREYHHLLGLNMDYGNFNPIFWKPNLYTVDASHAFWLHPEEKPNTPATEWGARDIRSATWAILKDAQTRQPVCLINTHLDHIGQQARIESTRLILKKWWEFGRDLPTVITGDFNTGSSMPVGRRTTSQNNMPLKLFEEAGFVDTFTVFQNDSPQSNTFHNFEGSRYDPTGSFGLWRIDWILVKGLIPVSCEIIKDAEPPIYPSDHYPVVAEIQRRSFLRSQRDSNPRPYR